MYIKQSPPGREGNSKTINDTSTMPRKSYSGKIPVDAFNALEWEAAGLVNGTATLILHIRDGELISYVTSRERCFVPKENCDG